MNLPVKLKVCPEKKERQRAAGVLRRNFRKQSGVRQKAVTHGGYLQAGKTAPDTVFPLLYPVSRRGKDGNVTERMQKVQGIVTIAC